MLVSATGHRPDKLGGWDPCEKHTKIKNAIRSVLQALPVSGAISGMALGVDTWFAEVCIELRIPLLAAIPCDGQESRWPKESQDHYHRLLAHAEKIVVSPGPYAAWKMQVRNIYMVDHCDLLLAVFDGSAGGTKNCVDYALQSGKRIWRIDPNVC